MRDMPRPRPPHLHREITRHGRTIWYVRVGKGQRVRIRHEYGTPEFEAAYQDAIAGRVHDPRKPMGGTLAWLVALYRESKAWSDLSQATRRQPGADKRPQGRAAILSGAAGVVLDGLGRGVIQPDLPAARLPRCRPSGPLFLH